MSKVYQTETKENINPTLSQKINKVNLINDSTRLNIKLSEPMMVKVSELKIHNMAAIRSTMSKSDFNSFLANVQEIGLQKPITLYRGKVVKGITKLRAANECNMDEIACVKIPNNTPLKDVEKYILSGAVHRKHDNGAQKAIHGYELYQSRKGEEKITQVQAAIACNTKDRYIQYIDTIAKLDTTGNVISNLKGGGRHKQKNGKHTITLTAIIADLINRDKGSDKGTQMLNNESQKLVDKTMEAMSLLSAEQEELIAKAIYQSMENKKKARRTLANRGSNTDYQDVDISEIALTVENTAKDTKHIEEVELPKSDGTMTNGILDKYYTIRDRVPTNLEWKAMKKAEQIGESTKERFMDKIHRKSA